MDYAEQLLDLSGCGGPGAARLLAVHMAQMPVDLTICWPTGCGDVTAGGQLGSSLQNRPTSCLCLWVGLYESEGSSAMRGAGKGCLPTHSQQACSPGQTHLPGRRGAGSAWAARPWAGVEGGGVCLGET